MGLIERERHEARCWRSLAKYKYVCKKVERNLAEVYREKMRPLVSSAEAKLASLWRATEARRGVKCSLKRPTHHQGWLAQAQSAAHQGCLAQAQSEAHSARVASASSSIASPAPAGSLVRWVLTGASAVVRAVAASALADWFPI